MNKYIGGTDITLDKLKQVMPTINVDGTTYQIEEWLKECEVFDKLIVNKSKVWIPYNSWRQGIVKEVVWQKHQFRHYSGFPDYAQDWFVMVPYCKVDDSINEGNYYVYEITFYKHWKRKTQMQELLRRQKEPKRRFLSKKDIAEIKYKQ